MARQVFVGALCISGDLDYQSYSRSGAVRRLEILPSEASPIKIKTASFALLRRNTEVDGPAGPAAGMRLTRVSAPPGQSAESRCCTHLVLGRMRVSEPA